MQVKLPAGVYRLYIVHAGFRIVRGDHVIEDPISYMHQGARVQRNSFAASFDFRTLKDLRIGMECDEMLACLITQHRAIWRAAIELLEPSVEEIYEATAAAEDAGLIAQQRMTLPAQHPLERAKAQFLDGCAIAHENSGKVRAGVTAQIPSDAHDVVTRGSSETGESVPGHAYRRFTRQPD